MSLSVRPTLWNLATSVATLEFGPGMLLLAAALLALKLSLLPFWTSQPGPPDCKIAPNLKLFLRWSNVGSSASHILPEQQSL